MVGLVGREEDGSVSIILNVETRLARAFVRDYERMVIEHGVFTYYPEANLELSGLVYRALIRRKEFNPS